MPKPLDLSLNYFIWKVKSTFGPHAKVMLGVKDVEEEPYRKVVLYIRLQHYHPEFVDELIDFMAEVEDRLPEGVSLSSDLVEADIL